MLSLATAACMFVAGLQQQQPTPAADLAVREVLVVGRTGEGGRTPFATDAVEAARVLGQLDFPGRSTADPEAQPWRPLRVAQDGWFRDRALRGGWAAATVRADRAEVALLDARGHGRVYVNGVPRGGDPYGLGLLRLPVPLQEGVNELLFQCGRGRLQIAFSRAPAEVFLEGRDPTLPDVVRGEEGELLLGVGLTNATTGSRTGLFVLSAVDGGPELRTELPALGPSSTRKVAVPVRIPADLEADAVLVLLRLHDANERQIHVLELPLQSRGALQLRARTFRSEVDGSVQEYCELPPAAGGEAEALVLSLHGAAVSARAQAGSYAAKDWAVLVAPTNRRPYGFDWEDWGRLDALEVLDRAQEDWGVDPARVLLTGHSMGGHGTWNLGIQFPDRFAALAPSAGWRDFWSYAGGARTWEEPTPIQERIMRAANGSRTLLFGENLLHQGVYVLHGDADSTVSVEQARSMREVLGAFHPNFAYHEQPGGGHWWGNACVDWPPLFDFLRAQRQPAEASLSHCAFVTVNPGRSSRCRWIEVLSQLRWMQPSRLEVTIDAQGGQLEARTHNVSAWACDLRTFLGGTGATADAGSREFRVTLDGQDLGRHRLSSGSRRLEFRRDAEGWVRVVGNDPERKGPVRSGPFKDAFQRRMVFVYGTQGTAEENDWAYRKARFDAETFQSRGNGAVDVVADRDFDPLAEPDRNVILYGDAESHARWNELVDGTLVLGRGRLQIGERELPGTDLGALFVRPRLGSDRALVAVVGGTGEQGRRALDALPYFVSGVGFPDWVVVGAEVWTEGIGGVRAAGYFDTDWSLGDDGAFEED